MDINNISEYFNYLEATKKTATDKKLVINELKKHKTNKDSLKIINDYFGSEPKISSKMLNQINAYKYKGKTFNEVTKLAIILFYRSKQKKYRWSVEEMAKEFEHENFTKTLKITPSKAFKVAQEIANDLTKEEIEMHQQKDEGVKRNLDKSKSIKLFKNLSDVEKKGIVKIIMRSFEIVEQIDKRLTGKKIPQELTGLKDSLNIIKKGNAFPKDIISEIGKIFITVINKIDPKTLGLNEAEMSGILKVLNKYSKIQWVVSDKQKGNEKIEQPIKGLNDFKKYIRREKKFLEETNSINRLFNILNG